MTKPSTPEWGLQGSQPRGAPNDGAVDVDVDVDVDVGSANQPSTTYNPIQDQPINMNDASQAEAIAAVVAPQLEAIQSKMQGMLDALESVHTQAQVGKASQTAESVRNDPSIDQGVVLSKSSGFEGDQYVDRELEDMWSLLNAACDKVSADDLKKIELKTETIVLKWTNVVEQLPDYDSSSLECAMKYVDFYNRMYREERPLAILLTTKVRDFNFSGPEAYCMSMTYATKDELTIFLLHVFMRVANYLYVKFPNSDYCTTVDFKKRFHGIFLDNKLYAFQDTRKMMDLVLDMITLPKTVSTTDQLADYLHQFEGRVDTPRRCQLFAFILSNITILSYYQLAKRLGNERQFAAQLYYRYEKVRDDPESGKLLRHTLAALTGDTGLLNMTAHISDTTWKEWLEDDMSFKHIFSQPLLLTG